MLRLADGSYVPRVAHSGTGSRCCRPWFGCSYLPLFRELRILLSSQRHAGLRAHMVRPANSLANLGGSSADSLPVAVLRDKVSMQLQVLLLSQSQTHNRLLDPLVAEASITSRRIRENHVAQMNHICRPWAPPQRDTDGVQLNTLDDFGKKVTDEHGDPEKIGFEASDEPVDHAKGHLRRSRYGVFLTFARSCDLQSPRRHYTWYHQR